MSLVVVGSLAIDQVVTPKGEKECLGGSASYFAYVASFFGPVRLVGVVGEDFPKPYMKLFEDRKVIDTSGIQHQPGKTFRWKGKYSEDMNSRETLEVHLNVFGEFDPVVPEGFREVARTQTPYHWAATYGLLALMFLGLGRKGEEFNHESHEQHE